MIETLADYVASQDELLQEASLALPHEFSKCTYALGHIRQAVYLCTTCAEPRGLCSACSIACHTQHEQIELFPKRKFRCDCPTVSLARPCTLHKNLEQENATNAYGPNFNAEFCRCGRPYDARTEQETMIQCLICEDWFHESCCNLRERPPSRKPSPVPLPELSECTEEEHDDDSPSEESADLPPGLITGTEYESFICGSCVSKNKTLMRWAGTPGITMVVRDAPTEPWRRLLKETPTREISVSIDESDNVDTTLTAGSKRPLSPSSVESPEAKRLRGDLQISETIVTCLAPPMNDIAQTIYAQLDSPSKTSMGTGDLFLSEGFREQWCHCSSCLPSLEATPCLLEEEVTYEPPEDPDSGLSLEELGMRALGRVPRDRAIDGIHAFNDMRDDLVKYLRPFAQEGKVVCESDVRQFFASFTEATNKGRK